MQILQLSQKLLSAFALVLVSLTNPTPVLQAQDLGGSQLSFSPPPPPDRGAPSGRSRGGASRGTCEAMETPLTALVPAQLEDNLLESVWAQAVSERPTFLFYVPYILNAHRPLEFVLQDEQNNTLYKAALDVSDPLPGVVKLTLPDTVAPLETGKMYHWSFLVYCDANAPMFVDGWVERIEPDEALNRQLDEATPREQVSLYAANGIWHEAIAHLAELRQNNPNDPELRSDWNSLLESVGLGDIVQKPIVDCCTLK